MYEWIKGRWPQLEHLALRWSELDALMIKVLVKASWSLQHLDLGQNMDNGGQLSTNGGHLSTCKRRNLTSLMLDHNVLVGEALAILCQAKWPHLSILATVIWMTMTQLGCAWHFAPTVKF